MATVVVLGVEGKKGLWMVDFDMGTVTPIADPLDGNLKSVMDLRAVGASISKGVDVAIKVDKAVSAVGGHMEG